MLSPDYNNNVFNVYVINVLTSYYCIMMYVVEDVFIILDIFTIHEFHMAASCEWYLFRRKIIDKDNRITFFCLQVRLRHVGTILFIP